MFKCEIYGREFLGEVEEDVLENVEEYEVLTFGRTMDAELDIVYCYEDA